MPVENVKIGTTSSAERRGQDKRISWGDNECYKTPSPVYKAAFEVKALADINSYLQSESCESCGCKDSSILDFYHNTDPAYNKAMAVDIGYMLPKVKRLREDCRVLCTTCVNSQ
tara:strand:- start:70 stop:411 length:342 start_codon:yes stop_codon:yes gene_type:complete